MQATNPSGNIKAALFDIDGTLIDSLPMLLAGLGDTFEHFTGTRPTHDALRTTIGIPLVEQMKIFGCDLSTEGSIQEISDYTVARYRAHSELESPFCAAVEALTEFKSAGVNTCGITSRNHDEVALLHEFHKWTSQFDAIVCASDVVNPKPDPESATKALSIFGVGAEDAIMFGDSIYDLRCARGANVRNAAVLYGAGKPESLLAESPDLVFDTPESLLEWTRETLQQQKQTHATEEERNRFSSANSASS